MTKASAAASEGMVVAKHATTMGTCLWAALLAGAVLAAAEGRARAAGAGSEPFDFLFLDAGARAVAMGGAYCALAGDSEAILYNPAALGRSRRNETTFMHNQYAASVTQEYLGFSSLRGWGAQVNYLSFGRVARTTISNPDGTGGYFGISDMALGLGYGREVASGLRVGGAAKLLRESIEGVTASGYAADAGALVLLPVPGRWTLGAAIQNLGPTVRYQKARENLPWALRLGAGCELGVLGKPSAAALDVTKERGDDPLVSLGVETWVLPSLALRAGFTGRDEAGIGLSGGFGWRRRDVQFDYALTPLGGLGAAHRLSATLRWGGQAALPIAESTSSRRNAGAEDQARAEELIELNLLAQARLGLEALGKRLAAQDPLQVRRLERLGHVHSLQGDMRQAKAAYMEALTLAIQLGVRDRYTAQTYAGMGRCLVLEGNHKYAVRFFEKALEAGLPSDQAQQVAAELGKLREAFGELATAGWVLVRKPVGHLCFQPRLPPSRSLSRWHGTRAPANLSYRVRELARSNSFLMFWA